VSRTSISTAPGDAPERDEAFCRAHGRRHGLLGATRHVLKRARIRALLRCYMLFLVACMVSATPVSAQSTISEELKQRLGQLRGSGTLVVGGLTISGQSPLWAVYEQARFVPLWNTNTANELVRALRAVAADGLEPAEYNLTAIEQPWTFRSAGEHAELDILRTDALIRVAYHLRYGKVDAEQASVRRAYTGSLRGGTVAVEIRRMIASGRLFDEVTALRPDHFVYRGLLSALARLRRIEQAGGWQPIPTGPALRLGSVDPRAHLLRQRLMIEDDLWKNSPSPQPRFDERMERGLRSFQHRHGLNADGVVGPTTLAELNVPVATRIDQVRINLERARWVTHDLPDTFIAVNIAGAMIYFVRNGTVSLETRAVVGNTYTATPVFRATMRYIDLNPTWTVPPGIAGEVLGAIQRNPGYLTTENMRVLTRVGAPIDPSSIDFASYSARTFPYTFRQEPGPRNPLGRIKFMFPNSYNVYLHDTPARELFERERRTFSHGCIRVHEPIQLATLILDDSVRWNAQSIQAAMESGETRTITLQKPIPVLILYWTASADLHGELHFYRDVYNRDAALLRALDGR
jgi:L,D-transpeptidase YcbB